VSSDEKSVVFSPLGKQSEYVDQYDASLLFPIPRCESRDHTGFGSRSAIFGEDIWNGYEVSWLGQRGKPEVRIAEIRIPARSQNLIESKSLKLYLNSLNQTRFASDADVSRQVAADLSQVAGETVEVCLLPLWHPWPSAPEAICLDELDISIDVYEPDASVLCLMPETTWNGWVCSHLLKSNCPVTGQPDWGSVYIHYHGHQIQPESLLAYIVSMRQHQGFHEQCVEQIFCDLMDRASPDELTVCARYVRRGGLDINPVRSTRHISPFPNFRLNRQ
jgi:7-cyano-7-deazaguanine reductase